MSWFRRRADPVHDPLPGLFEPPASDYAAFVREVRAIVGTLLPGGVDEATPHVLDGLIECDTRARQARLVKVWLRYRSQLAPHLVQARAELAYEAIVNEAEQRELGELRLARDAALRELLGMAALPSGLSSHPQITPRPQE